MSLIQTILFGLMKNNAHVVIHNPVSILVWEGKITGIDNCTFNVTGRNSSDFGVKNFWITDVVYIQGFEEYILTCRE